MKTLIILLLLSTNAIAAKPIEPYYMTVDCYINGIKLGSNIKVDDKTTWDAIAYEIWEYAPRHFHSGDSVEFIVEWPRYGYEPITIYGCVENQARSFRVVNRIEDC